MQIIRATQKLLKELDVKGTILPKEVVPIAPLGPWYANLLRIDRRKCILFTHEETLYSFLVTGVRKKDLNNFRGLFSVHLGLNLQAENFPTSVIDLINKQNEKLEITKTTNRSTLGSMNDQSFAYKVHVEHEGGVDGCAMLEINKRINRTPMGALGYKYPIEKLAEKLRVKDHITIR